MCLARYLTEMLYSRRVPRVVCVDGFLDTRRWDHIFLEGNETFFCWVILMSFFTKFAFRARFALVFVYAIRLLCFLFTFLMFEKKKFSEAYSTCVCVHWWKCVQCVGEKSPFAFFFWNVGKLNFHFFIDRLDEFLPLNTASRVTRRLGSD